MLSSQTSLHKLIYELKVSKKIVGHFYLKQRVLSLDNFRKNNSTNRVGLEGLGPQ